MHEGVMYAVGVMVMHDMFTVRVHPDVHGYVCVGGYRARVGYAWGGIGHAHSEGTPGCHYGGV